MDPRSDEQKLSMRMILQTTCQTTLQAFAAADNALDDGFVADLGRIIARTQGEIDALTAQTD